MSSSSSEEDVDDAFKESANCDYIHRMVNTPKLPPGSTKKKKSSLRTTANEGNPSPKDTDFENFLAQRLAKRLDERIKIVEKGSSCPGEYVYGGIKLFSSSPVVAELEELSDENPQRRRAVEEPNVDYKERAREAAVSAEWVCDASNTVHWKDNKKPRLMKTAKLKNLANGGLECKPLTNLELGSV